MRVTEITKKTTHRLICDDCLKVIAHYSFKTTEQAFMKQLGVFR